MSTNTDQYRTLIQLVLPKEIFDYFNLLKLEKLISKGFHSSITIQDFPIRDKPLFLHVRRRRWQVESTGALVAINLFQKVK